jgi:hypothetical protein
LATLFNYLRITRPANIITSVSDVWAGIAISGILFGVLNTEVYLKVLFLSLSTIGLYGGGIVFNDVFDFELDKKERPERTIPSGKISLRNAIILGTILLMMGVFFALLVSELSRTIAFLIVVSALVYNKWSKHHPYLGPPNMGLCRGLNLLLGISILNFQVYQLWHIALVPIIYISAITLISRGEVTGSKAKPIYIAAVFYAIVIFLIGFFAFQKNNLLMVIPFLAGFMVMIYKPLINAIQSPIGPNIGKAVKSGVIALIIMNASWAAAAGLWQFAILILFLLPISIWLSKIFAVT